MKKIFFISATMIGLGSIAIPVFVIAKNKKIFAPQRNYFIVKGKGTKWNHEVIMERGSTINDALIKLNFNTATLVHHIYESIYRKANTKISRGDKITHDMTIKID